MRRPRAAPLAILLIALTTTTAMVRPAAPLPTVTVYKLASCGCCAKWVDHMRAAGFKVEVNDVADVGEYADGAGVPPALRSCHTAVVGGYAIEGHVPADLVKKMLTEHPAIAGLAVPGMVTGSPGMEGNRREPYDVVAWSKQGTTSVYARR
ncbi:MAG TPA: DUF411 domain-containing protein [Gemmatimonadales bacterium]|nr:DUF411 domain-containing protein [Gemmatimonadales bacterium]